MIAHAQKVARLPRAKPVQSAPPPPTPAETYRLLQLEAEREKLERLYDQHVIRPLCALGYPAPKPQARLIAGRKFAYDYAFIPAKLAVEIQGQIWHKGGHTSGGGITRDAIKLNELAAIGWRCLHLTAAQIASGEAYDWTERALRAAGLRAAGPRTTR